MINIIRVEKNIAKREKKNPTRKQRKYNVHNNKNNAKDENISLVCPQ